MSAASLAQATILLVDDTLDNLNVLITCLEDTGFRIAVARSGEEALERVAYAAPDLILLDVMMPGIDGFETCRRLKTNSDLHDIPVIFMTVMSELTDKVEGFEAGGVDYIIKPFYPEEVAARIQTHLKIRQLQQELQTRNALLQEKNEQLQQEIAIRKQTEEALQRSKSHEIELEQENVTLRTGLGERYKFGDLIGKSPAMQDVYEAIARAAACDATVLICGESGTGKEIVAHTIHALSARKQHGFVPVNCSAVPETIFEREFFGHRKGAFTNAIMDSPGYFDQAHRGTLFLDEVAELSPALQAKLLRALQNKEYTPLGAAKSKQVDVRIISATNQDVPALLRAGEMREDFFYRIYGIVITIPPLRERREDIPLLIEHFLASEGQPRSRTALPGKIMDTLCSYHWPGNVRELHNELQRYLIEQHFEFIGNDDAAGRNLAADRGFDLDFDLTRATLHEAVEAFEKALLANALVHNAWHRGNTARQLDIPTKTLYNKIKQYGLEHEGE